MDIKVREVTTEEKSSQQIEQELLDKHEQKQEEVSQQETVEEVKEEVEVKEDVQEEVQEEIKEEPETPPVVEEQPPVPQELAEDEVLSYIGKRYGKQINSIDELISKREEAEELPSDVAAYLKYKKETGRGFNDLQNCKKITLN